MDKPRFEIAFDPSETRVVDLSTGEDVYAPDVARRAKIQVDKAIEAAGGIVVPFVEEGEDAEVIPLFDETPEGESPA